MSTVVNNNQDVRQCKIGVRSDELFVSLRSGSMIGGLINGQSEGITPTQLRRTLE